MTSNKDLHTDNLHTLVHKRLTIIIPVFSVMCYEGNAAEPSAGSIQQEAQSTKKRRTQSGVMRISGRNFATHTGKASLLSQTGDKDSY